MPGWFSQLNVWLLILAQVMIRGSWDWALHQRHQTLRSAQRGACLRFSLSFFNKNKIEFEKEENKTQVIHNVNVSTHIRSTNYKKQQMFSKVSKYTISVKILHRGTWVAQLLECATSAQVMIWRFMSSSPTLGSLLQPLRAESTSDPLSPSLCSFPTCALPQNK